MVRGQVGNARSDLRDLKEAGEKAVARARDDLAPIHAMRPPVLHAEKLAADLTALAAKESCAGEGP